MKAISAICIAGIIILSSLYTGRDIAEASSQYIRPAISDIRADAYIVVDKNTGKTIMEHNAERAVHPASLTKILTGIIAIEKINGNDIITISQNAGSLSNNESKIDLIPGEEMPFRDVFFGMMIASGNDAAVALAEHISGDLQSFALLMNSKSNEIGTVSSKWINPSGITNEGHVSTARDLAMITRYAYRYEMFREAVSTKYYSLPVTNKHPYTDWNVLENSNKLMRLQDQFYDLDVLYEINGVKTGTTSAAGTNLISSAHAKNGLELICVLNGVRASDARYIWNYTAALLEGSGVIETGVHNVFRENEALSIIADGKTRVVFPERSFSLFDPAADSDIEYTLSVSDDDKYILVTIDDEVVFRSFFSVEDESPSDESYESDISEPDMISDRSLSRRDIIVGGSIIAALLIYTIIIWAIAAGKSRTGNSKKRSKNNRLM